MSPVQTLTVFEGSRPRRQRVRHLLKAQVAPEVLDREGDFATEDIGYSSQMCVQLTYRRGSHRYSIRVMVSLNFLLLLPGFFRLVRSNSLSSVPFSSSAVGLLFAACSKLFHLLA